MPIRTHNSWLISKRLCNLLKKGSNHKSGFLFHPDTRHLLTTLMRINPCLGTETAPRALLEIWTETQQVLWAGFSGNRIKENSPVAVSSPFNWHSVSPFLFSARAKILVRMTKISCSAGAFHIHNQMDVYRDKQSRRTQEKNYLPVLWSSKNLWAEMLFRVVSTASIPSILVPNIQQAKVLVAHAQLQFL